MLSNCGVGEDSWKSIGSKEIKPVNPKGNQPWRFIGRIEAEAEVPILWPPDVKTELLKKTLMLWKIEGRKKSGQQGMGWFGGIPDSVDMNLSKLQELSVDREDWCAAVHGISKNQTWLTNWTELKLL